MYYYPIAPSYAVEYPDRTMCTPVRWALGVLENIKPNSPYCIIGHLGLESQ